MKYLLQVRGGHSIWMNEDQKQTVEQALLNNVDWVKVRGNLINSKDISGIVTEDVAVDRIQQKRGLYKLDDGKYHSREERENNFRSPYIPENEKLSFLGEDLKKRKKLQTKKD